MPLPLQRRMKKKNPIVNRNKNKTTAQQASINIMSTDLIEQLRTGIATHAKFSLIDSEDKPCTISQRPVSLVIESSDSNKTTVPTGSETKYGTVLEVYNVWDTRDMGVMQYIEACEERGIRNLKFVDRKEVLTALKGGQKEKSADGTRKVDGRKRRERVMMNHNSVLRGSKQIVSIKHWL